MVDDVPGTDASLDQTYGIGTSAILQFGLALVDERNKSLKIGLKLEHADGLPAGHQHLVAEAPRNLYGQDSPIGEVIAPTQALLALFKKHACRATFFVLGEVAEFYPQLIEEIVAHGHELACHGWHHVDMTVLGPSEFARQLDRAARRLEQISGSRPRGYRAPNLVYEPWATRILENHGFSYDSTVCVSRPVGGKYRGWAHAPLHPYRPSYNDVARPGGAVLVEVPLPPFPVVRISAGSGITTRILGRTWTLVALRSAIRTGETRCATRSS